jgi:hypothetical protein
MQAEEYEGVCHMAFMCRSINTVGQGAFYTESFIGEEEIHVVYDCGSSTSPKIIESTIERVFVNDEEIAAVFISHFDEDHINGLEYLLKYCKVKYLFLPLMQEDDKALLLIHFLIKKIPLESFVYSFLEAPERVIDVDRTQIIYISEFNGEIRYEDREDGFPLDGVSDRSGIRQILSGTHCRFKNNKHGQVYDWVYIPYNFKSSERHDMLIDKFNKKGIPIPESPSKAYLTYQKHVKELKQIYKSMPEGINVNSMVLYSGPNLGYANSYFFTYHNACCLNAFPCKSFDLNFYCQSHNINCCVGCLYTGDYNLLHSVKWDMLKNCFQQYWEYIGTWQIPHHGSVLSYNSKIAENENITSVFISAGMSNSHKHPHESVVRSLLANDINLFIVTENRESQIRYLIHAM